ncbi:hypothetical protein BLA29_009200 [Euroglyphus maynei]|uniref:DFP2-like protein n=1 Tax=Euroglyphus maynei TaxID=6958 RepID=A0A1Y3BUG5_EURMA|nr:hypothetical protein BLA29_009200 [Euroglyphus maynei]
MICDRILCQHYQYPTQQQQQSNQFYGNNNNQNNNNIVQAAIVRQHRIIYVNSPAMDNSKPVTIQVPAQSIPLTLILRSISSNLNIIPQHDGSNGGHYEETESMDEPHRLIHIVRKPIIQEIYEVITPYRYVKQEIQPVKETIRTPYEQQESQQQQSINWQNQMRQQLVNQYHRAINNGLLTNLYGIPVL